MCTYNDVFKYLASQTATNGCDCTLRHTKRFAKMHGLRFYDLTAILRRRGGHCDCTVILNAFRYLDEDHDILEDTGPNAERYAREKGYYCHCLVDGIPASIEDAGAAEEAGRHVEKRVRCDKNAPNAELDTTRAAMELAPEDWEELLEDADHLLRW